MIGGFVRWWLVLSFGAGLAMAYGAPNDHGLIANTLVLSPCLAPLMLIPAAVIRMAFSR